jgi:hypothetical protein
LGYIQEGLIMILATLVGSVFTHRVASFAMGVIGLVEGIIYFTKSDSKLNRQILARR